MKKKTFIVLKLIPTIELDIGYNKYFHTLKIPYCNLFNIILGGSCFSLLYVTG